MPQGLDVVEALRRVLAEPGEETRRLLAEAFASDPAAAAEELARRVGGDAAPDTCVATVRAEVAAVAVAAAHAAGRRLRLIVPRDPVPGWAPLRAVAAAAAEAGLAEVYEAPLLPGSRLHASAVERRLARLLRGISPGCVDVTDAPATAVLAAYAAGVRCFLYLVDTGYSLVYQRFSAQRG